MKVFFFIRIFVALQAPRAVVRGESQGPGRVPGSGRARRQGHAMGRGRTVADPKRRVALAGQTRRGPAVGTGPPGRRRSSAPLHRTDRGRGELAAAGAPAPRAAGLVCHGDFCRNNVMFRYDGSRRPVDALPLDFGTPRYGSPALDVSFFVYLNSTRLLRERRLDELLDVYCAALAAAVPTGVRVPGRAELDAEMAASALFGFAHASFFLPYQSRGHGEDEFDLDYTSDELIDRLLAAGGDQGTEQVADMVRHFVRMGYTAV